MQGRHKQIALRVCHAGISVFIIYADAGNRPCTNDGKAVVNLVAEKNVVGGEHNCESHVDAAGD